MARVEVHREQFEFLAGPFREWTDLPCLICHRGALEPTISEFESKVSIDARAGAEILGGPMSGFFHGELTCSRVQCGNNYVVAGEWTRGSESPDEDIAEVESYDPRLYGFTVRHVLPPLPLIALPDKTPIEVQVLVESASSVLLSDPSVASGRIRTAIEALLDAQGVRKMQRNSRTHRLTTHDRIQLFESKNKIAADRLMAVKWIGNVGVHDRDPLPLEFVLDGIELFARAIEIIYDPRDSDLDRLAMEINRKKGRNLRPRSLKART
jgi:Domain of unknown function (DUF4145)